MSDDPQMSHSSRVSEVQSTASTLHHFGTTAHYDQLTKLLTFLTDVLDINLGVALWACFHYSWPNTEVSVGHIQYHRICMCHVEMCLQ